MRLPRKVKVRDDSSGGTSGDRGVVLAVGRRAGRVGRRCRGRVVLVGACCQGTH